jgi:prolyl oligopeptidase
LDPNKLSDDGTVALSTSAFSENAEFLAVGLSSSGSDWINIKVMKVADKSWEPDVLSWVYSTMHSYYQNEFSK